MRIGLIVNILDEAYQLSVYKGIKGRAKQLGIDLICFQQENTKFSTGSLISNFPDKKFFDIDGMILLTSVIIDSSEINYEEDVKRIWGNLPVVSVGQKIQNVPSIMIQTDGSMKQLVEHLILFHKYRKFVFIGGAQNHHDAISRETIFVQTMQAYQAWFPDLEYKIKYGGFTENGAIQAMNEYVKENPHNQPDVIVCANDNMALGIYKYFKMNRDNPSVKECPVTGFDDVPQARFELPPLTTVSQPMEEIGVCAVDSLLEIIDGKKVPQESYIESKVVIRKSCGCSEIESNEPFSSESDAAYFEKIQLEYLLSERQLRMVNHVEQDLNYAQTLGRLRYSINENLEQLEVPDFCILKFVSFDGKIIDPESGSAYVNAVYLRKNFKYEPSAEFIGAIPLGDFYRKYLKREASESESYVFKYLTAGKEIIGCILYESNENYLPYLCSIGISIAQTINRINAFEERKKHSEFLESEVQKRTKELIEANNKRMEVEAEVLKISEIERQRFSNDLHDDICQRLAGISMLCRSYSNQQEPIQKSQMVELAELISDTLQCTRQYAHNSYPVELESLGMNHSLNNLCNSFEVQSGIKCVYEWKLSDDIYFDKIEKLNIFRIIQEALHNVMKHSNATEVNVRVRAKDDVVFVDVCDNGKGIHQPSDKPKGLGLNSMQYRANQIGAAFNIYNNTPNGTCIEVSLDRSQKKSEENQNEIENVKGESNG